MVAMTHEEVFLDNIAPPQRCHTQLHGVKKEVQEAMQTNHCEYANLQRKVLSLHLKKKRKKTHRRKIKGVLGEPARDYYHCKPISSAMFDDPNT
jgi:hypothetical protein